EPADSRTDLYGLAVVLYEIVTGRVPFRSDTPLATMLAHVHQPVPEPATLRTETALAVAVVLVRALAKPRDERYQSVADLAGAFRAAVSAAYGESQIATGAYPYLASPADVARVVPDERTPRTPRPLVRPASSHPPGEAPMVALGGPAPALRPRDS